nr:hypothetical protein [Gammaproteobacteria bacterium]
LSTNGTAELVIHTEPDGLPAQSASTNGQVLTSTNSVAGWADLSTATLPTQTDKEGQFLTTNGTLASWGAVDAFPLQTGNTGKFLQSDGDEVSWQSVDAFPSQTDNLGKYLVVGAEGPAWNTVPSILPDQTDNQNKYLVTDGSNASWQTVSTAGQTGNITFSSSTISSSDTDTVTFDDKIYTTKQVDVGKLVITGAQAPKVASTSSYEITAPDGVTHNGFHLPCYQGCVSIGDDYTNITNNVSGLSMSSVPSAGRLIFTMQGVGSSFGTSDYFVKAQYNSTTSASGAIEVNLALRQWGSVFEISLKPASGDLTSVDAGLIFIQVYEI